MQGATLALQGRAHTHGGHSPVLGVLGVGIVDHLLQEDLQHLLWVIS